jgi:hypothetical protein
MLRELRLCKRNRRRLWRARRCRIIEKGEDGIAVG